MWKLKYISYLLLVFAFVSCSDEKLKIKDHRFDVKYSFKIGDSIVLDKFQEYWLDIKVADSIFFTKKTLFKMVRESMSKPGTAYILDSIKINYTLNSDFEIEKIVNYKELYNKTYQYLNKFFPNYRNNLKLNDFVQKVCLDSTYITNKQTKSLTIFNNALHYLQKPNDFAKVKVKELTEINYKQISYRYDIQKAYLKNYFNNFTEGLDLTGGLT